MTKTDIVHTVENYLHFNGIIITTEQKYEIVDYLEQFKEDEQNLISEMVCEIRTLIGE